MALKQTYIKLHNSLQEEIKEALLNNGWSELADLTDLVVLTKEDHAAFFGKPTDSDLHNVLTFVNRTDPRNLRALFKFFGWDAQTVSNLLTDPNGRAFTKLLLWCFDIKEDELGVTGDLLSKLLTMARVFSK